MASGGSPPRLARLLSEAVLLIGDFLLAVDDFEAVILSAAKNLLFSRGSGTQADASLRSA